MYSEHNVPDSKKIFQLTLAALGFLICFINWFAGAAFSVAIMKDFHLEKVQLAILASSNMWLQPIFRQFVGVFTDKLGAPKTAAFTLFYTGVFSILSAFSVEYWQLFSTRLIVATAGIFFVIGIQHVAQWFDEHEMGLAEGIYAGTGNAGAGLGALFLPRIYGLDYHSAFIHLGILSLIVAVLYLIFGVAAVTKERAEAAKKSATTKDTFYVITRWTAIALMLQYAMTFGLEIGMNAWLPGYYRLAFADALKALGYVDLKAMAVAAGTLASVQSLQASFWRPFSGMVSDMFLKHRWMPWPFLTKEDPMAPRVHWVFTSMVGVSVMMVALTLAGLTGSPVISVTTLAILGFVISWGTGSNFALTPALFKRCPGVATGFIGGICTIGGIIYPLIYGLLPNIHYGYAVVSATMFVPFMIIFIIAFRRGRPIMVDAGIGTYRSWGVEPLFTPVEPVILESPVKGGKYDVLQQSKSS